MTPEPTKPPGDERLLLPELAEEGGSVGLGGVVEACVQGNRHVQDTLGINKNIR